MYVIIVIAAMGGTVPPWLQGLEFIPECESVKCGEIALMACDEVIHEYVRQGFDRRIECVWEAK